MKYKKITEFLTVTLLFSLGISQTYTVQASSSNETKVVKKYKYDYTDQKKAPGKSYILISFTCTNIKSGLP